MGILMRLRTLCLFIRGQWGYPRRWAIMCLALMPAVIIGGIGAITNPTLCRNLTLVDGNYAGFNLQVRIVIGVTLLACTVLSIFNPRVFLVSAVGVMSAQRTFQNLHYSPTPNLLSVAIWAGVFVAACICTYTQNKRVIEGETAKASLATAVREYRGD